MNAKTAVVFLWFCATYIYICSVSFFVFPTHAPLLSLSAIPALFIAVAFASSRTYRNILGERKMRAGSRVLSMLSIVLLACSVGLVVWREVTSVELPGMNSVYLAPFAYLVFYLGRIAFPPVRGA